MSKKKANFIIPLVIYPFELMVSLGQTDEELKKSLAKYSFEWDEGMKLRGIGRFFMNEQGKSVIRLMFYPETNHDYGTLNHELFHFVMNIMDIMGTKFIIGKNEEPYAYLIGYLTTEIYKRI